jgi:UDP-N-acetyl-D-galactosamine dehydrogenase
MASTNDDLVIDYQKTLIGVIGLGYVGLPLAVEFGKVRPVIGYDTNTSRISELRAGEDNTREVDIAELSEASYLKVTADINTLKACRIFIVTVPTPVDKANRPDFGPLLNACDAVGGIMQKGSLVIFESTVYPGATEEVCVPTLEKKSAMKFNRDFYCGYSPERINPGDKHHRLTKIVKVTSGSTSDAADAVDTLYRQIITAGTHKASSIKVAEAAKVIENTQRDVNIALINELSMIFTLLGIDTQEVLEAAGTKWNFLPFRPGLVGGHCIGVDPYYLTHKAQEVGYHPEVILAGRRINDSMAAYVAEQVVKLMVSKGHELLRGRVLVLGFTFKENCPDLRNTKVIDLVEALLEYRLEVDIYDPFVKTEQAPTMPGILFLAKLPDIPNYSAIVVAVGHSQFLELGECGIKSLAKPGAIIYDVKSIYPRDFADGRL